MIAPLAKYLDWWAVQYVSLTLPPASSQAPRLQEALQFLQGPDFVPAASEPARMEFEANESGRFKFPSPRPGSFPENNIAYGRLYRCGKTWQEHPVIILLHGGGDFLNHRFRFPLIAGRCNRAGFNAATLALPYHFNRRTRPRKQSNGRAPSQKAEAPGFPFPTAGARQSCNYLRLAEAMAQAIAEIRALAGWILAEGCPAVVLWGISLGGWLAGITACRDASIASVVLATPGVRFDFRFAQLSFGSNIRRSWAEQQTAWDKLNGTPLNVASAKPVIPKENILLIEGVHDLLVLPEAVEDLWQAWDRPQIWRLPHGHISWMGSPGLTGHILAWLTQGVRLGQISQR